MGGVSASGIQYDIPARIAGHRSGVGAGAQLHLWTARVLALALLAAFAPLMMIFAWLIRRDGGAATFAHYRVGCDGRLFRCLKFRTMHAGAEGHLVTLLERDPGLREEWARSQKLVHDPRVTPIGRWLRRSSLDELPQLWNVVRGEMTLVGPRPVTVPELRRYGAVRWQYLSVVPGMTGLWQVSGRNRTSYERRIELDQQYVCERSAWLDCRILAKTLMVVITRDGAI